MAHIPLARVEDLPPEARAIVAGSERRWGFLPHIVAALAHRPGLLAAEDHWSRAVMAEGELPRPLKEAVAMVVSAVNRCAYCAASHDHAAARHGADPGVRAACQALRFGALPPAERAALEFARKAAAEVGRVTRADVERLREHYTPAQVVELAAVVGSFMMYNTFVTALGLEVEPALGGPAPRKA